MQDKTESARAAYKLLSGREGRLVTAAEISAATGYKWSIGTVGNYRSKKWKGLTERIGPGIFKVTGVSLLSEDEFVALQSQVTEAVVEPRVRIVAESLAQGEGQSVEFKEEVPDRASHLAQEVAAFATSNDAVILIGVEDDGGVVGYSDGVERLEGIVGAVTPSVTAIVDVVPFKGEDVGLIRVLKGDEPLYYVADRAYVRQGTLSRPATADEVKARVDRYLRRG